ncbi:MAG TPA: ABC transporter permease [Anaerolineaceae bacterium]|nr:ABC transporter permease [Anaerolineaceae bacterium]
MKKIFNIALKDLLINFRDPMGLVLMLAAPLALTLVIAAAFGGVGGGGSAGLADIPVVIVNHDTGDLSPYLVEAFYSEGLVDLVEPSTVNDDATARAAVDADEVAAAVIIPDNFSESILPAGLVQGDISSLDSKIVSVVEIYANPGRPVSATVIRSIVDTVLNQFISGRIGSEITINQLIASGRLSPAEAQQQGMIIGQSLGAAEPTERITLSEETGTASSGFNWLEYSAPSLAILFMMFTLSAAGRTLLIERDHGTLPRMLVSPTSRAEILGGKLLGNFLTGLLQMTILIVAGGFLFGISWGNPLAVGLLTLAVVAAVTGWGMLPAAFARTPGQANAIGTAITLTFGAAAGSFVPRGALPEWLQKAGLVTPNAWGIEGYYNLIKGATLTETIPAILALLVMAIILFGIAVLAFRRQYA